MSKTRVYKDIVVSEGTKMWELLDQKKVKEADKHYQTCMAEFHKYFPKEVWQNVKETLRRRRT